MSAVDGTSGGGRAPAGNFLDQLARSAVNWNNPDASIQHAPSSGTDWLSRTYDDIKAISEAKRRQQEEERQRAIDAAKRDAQWASNAFLIGKQGQPPEDRLKTLYRQQWNLDANNPQDDAALDKIVAVNNTVRQNVSARYQPDDPFFGGKYNDFVAKPVEWLSKNYSLSGAEAADKLGLPADATTLINLHRYGDSNPGQQAVNDFVSPNDTVSQPERGPISTLAGAGLRGLGVPDKAAGFGGDVANALAFGGAIDSGLGKPTDFQHTALQAANVAANAAIMKVGPGEDALAEKLAGKTGSGLGKFAIKAGTRAATGAAANAGLTGLSLVDSGLPAKEQARLIAAQAAIGAGVGAAGVGVSHISPALSKMGGSGVTAQAVKAAALGGVAAEASNLTGGDAEQNAKLAALTAGGVLGEHYAVPIARAGLHGIDKLTDLEGRFTGAPERGAIGLGGKFDAGGAGGKFDSFEDYVKYSTQNGLPLYYDPAGNKVAPYSADRLGSMPEQAAVPSAASAPAEVPPAVQPPVAGSTFRRRLPDGSYEEPQALFPDFYRRDENGNRIGMNYTPRDPSAPPPGMGGNLELPIPENTAGGKPTPLEQPLVNEAAPQPVGGPGKPPSTPAALPDTQRSFVPTSVPASALSDFRVGQDAYFTNLTRAGRVDSIDGSGTVTIVNGSAKQQVPVSRLVSSSDAAAATAKVKYDEAVRTVMPTDEHIAAATQDMNDSWANAASQLDSKRLLAKATGKFGKLIDPAVGYASDARKAVLTGALMLANNTRRDDAGATSYAHQLWQALAPLTQEGGPRIKKGFVDVSTRDVGRATLQAGAAAAPAAAGFAASNATGNDMYKDIGVLASVGALSAMQRAQRAGVFTEKPWERIKLHVADPAMPKDLRSGQGKLKDILERPDQYDIAIGSPEYDAVNQYREIRKDMLRQTNAYQQAAGQDLIPENQANAIFHWLTKDSLKDEGLINGNPTVDVHSTTFKKTVPIERRRTLGDTYYDVLTAHPGLKMEGNVLDLLAEEAKQHARIRSSASFTAKMREQNYMISTANNPDLAAQLMERHWNQIPGIKDAVFHPDVVQGVSDLMATSQGKETGVVNWLDNVTNNVRQVLFTGDLSPWFVQGAMLAMENPVATARNAHHLIGASVFGDRYFRYWQEKYPDLWKNYTNAGGAGREFGGLEKEGALLNAIPGFKHLEDNGFGSFLAIHRATMFDHIKQQDAFLQKLGPLKHLGGSDVGRTVLEGLQYAPTAGGGALAASGNQIDIPGLSDKYDKLFTVALGGLGSLIAGGAVTRAGGAVYKGLGEDSQRTVDARAAKEVNRVSGTLNRQQIGQSAVQSQIERTFLFRSPALTRNALSLAKLAITNTGPEGAAARLYLVKTAALLSVGLAGLKYFSTGQPIEADEFDPTKPGSLLYPGSFLRASMGERGSAAPSNPLISLARAFLHSENPTGQTGYHPSLQGTAVGLKDFAQARLPDVTGKFTGPALDGLVSGLQDPSQTQQPGFANRLAGDTASTVRGAMKSMMPVSVQTAIDSGVLANTATGDALGMTGKPDYNHPDEQKIGIGSAFAGLNYNPETVSAENTRLRDEETLRQLPSLKDRTGDGVVDYNDTNAVQKADIQKALKSDTAFQSTKSTLAAKNLATDQPAPITHFLDQQATENNRYQGLLKTASDEFMRTGDGVKFRATYQTLGDDHRARLTQVKQDLGDESAQLRGRDDTVSQWLDRYTKPEDQAVNHYYDLYQSATDPVTGKLDFDLLDRKQKLYMKLLPPGTAKYVQDRVASFDSPSSIAAVKEYDQVKATTKTYFGLGDEVWDYVKGSSPVLAQFKTHAQFEAYVQKVADANGIQLSDALAIMAKGDKGVKAYNDILTSSQEAMRDKNPKLDAALVKWYGYAPRILSGKFQRATGKAGVIQDIYGVTPSAKSLGIDSSVYNDAPAPKKSSSSSSGAAQAPTQHSPAYTSQTFIAPYQNKAGTPGYVPR